MSDNSQTDLCSAGPSSEPSFVVETLKNKGRGVVATRAIRQGSLIFATRPDITVLYSAFGCCTCSRCFRAVQEARAGIGKEEDHGDAEPPAFVCPHCDQFVLCDACAAALAADVEMANHMAEEEARDAKRTLCLLSRHPQLRLHQLSCSWYNELPASVRARGLDTDMLRFCLDYGARHYFATAYAPAQSGGEHSDRPDAFSAADEAAVKTWCEQFVSNVAGLDTAAEVQSEDVLRFCTTFARDKVVKTFGQTTAAATSSSSLPGNASDESGEGKCSHSGRAGSTPRAPRLAVSAEELRDVLLRTQVNSLGFPFSASDTLGWSLERTVCMLNHSCVPNAAVVPVSSAVRSSNGAEQDRENPTEMPTTHVGGDWIGIRAVKDIAVGAEITISYVDMIDYGDNVRERSRALLERYRFLCRCEKCEAQRAARQRGE